LTVRADSANVYVMKTKLTLRMEDALVKRAKSEARRRGKSVSLMMSEYIDTLGAFLVDKKTLPPVTASLLGVLKGKPASEEEYKKHLRKKYG
jgi:hypothetical protein